MADSRVASRYVKSLLGLAVEKQALEQVHADMELFAGTCKAHPEFALMLKSPIIRHEKKRAILNGLLKGKVNVLTLAFVDIITQKNREPLLQSISQEFHHAYNEYKGIEQARVTTTIPMDPQIRKEVEAIVRKLTTKSNIELVEKVDPSLVGGFVLGVGDKLVDASVKNKLRNLKVKFS
ncbi:MAG: ATP synthase F1 subunit delta [Cyclobacteriaceae bacterium]|nr:ATP synthase F1 subunit delta [Cyclobacteriaceae bacterium]